MARSKPMRLFYSYSSKDERYMDELEANLSLLKYNKLIKRHSSVITRRPRFVLR
jgi:hypothetical protein